MAKFGDIVEDLKASWYFRIWAVLWLVCAIVSFVSLIIISEASRIEGEEGSLRIWFERTPNVAFPDFQIFAPHDMKILTSQCAFMGKTVAQKGCVGWVVDTQHSCVAFTGSSVSAFWDPKEFSSMRIDCNITTDLTQWNRTEDMLVGWDLVNTHPAGDNSLGPLWIAPNNLAWVLLTKKELQTKDFSGVMWDRVLSYQESQGTPGKYRIQSVMDKLFVEHYEYGTHDNGWRALGTIGGFAFFTYILHTIVMAVVGLCLDNDSHFLNPVGGSTYAKV